MSYRLKPLPAILLAGALASLGVAATAQPVFTPSAPSSTASSAPAPQADSRGGRHFDPAKMQAHLAKRQAELKAKLNIGPAQENAWASYTAAMQPPMLGARPAGNPRAELERLSTPERIDKMRALRTQRMAEISAYMDKRDQATKALYSALTPEQQKTFDTEFSHRGHDRKHGWNRRFG